MVSTIMSPSRASLWHGSTRMAVGRALLAGSDEGGMTAGEMSLLAQQHQSNLKKAADELVDDGALKYTIPAPANGRPGPKARVAYVFSEGEQQRFEELVEDEMVVGLLGLGTELVMVDAEDQAERLSEVLSQPEVTADAAWTAHVRGQRAEVWLAFEGHRAPDDSLDLMAVLRSAELKARHGSVAKLANAGVTTRTEERRKRHVERVRAQLQAQRPNPGP